MTPPVATLTVNCYAGLCNRLQVLLSGAALAEATGRAFQMIWPATDACSAPFDRLFTSPWPVFASVPAGTAPLLVYSDLCRPLPPDLLTWPPGDLGLIAGGSLFSPAAHAAHRTHVSRAATLIDQLRPVPALDARIETFARAHFRPWMIGAHLRRGDFVRRQPDLVANTDLAFAAIDRLLEREPAAGIFLSTDDGGPDQVTSRLVREGLRERFRERYGARVVWATPRSLDRREPAAIEDAVVDLWLLRRTHALVGSTGSSFSGMAVLGREVDAVMCGAPKPGYARIERWARLTGVDALLRAIPLRSRPMPDASFAQVWSFYATLPRAIARKWTGRRR